MSQRPMPDDFVASLHLSMRQLCRKYQAGKPAVYRWFHEAGVQHRAGGVPAKQRPEDFADMQEGRTVPVLQAHYGVCKAVIQRWLREIGINRSRMAAAAAAQTRRAAPAARPIGFDRAGHALSGKVERPHIDQTPAGQAAEYLRRLGPVVRCNEQGRYDPAGNRWRRGSSLLTADEIIERAVRNGWQAERRAA